ncbi:hypothetical protein TTRE_0000630801 [Trichuris trichiura]|uniref:Uncharacterized protein n=1 Tax=Trichuris trichiura TaxID=36087 RepID=A0A077ZC86_TRITR|nr:hypothetical protein TTRE_0000630801 [Trichuris trichiura]
MERETLRRQAEEARRCGATESINGVPLDSDGTKPIFGPPVKICNRDDSLHRKLQKCLGNFDDVSGYLFKDMHYSGRGMELSVGLDCSLVRTGSRSRLNVHNNGTMATKGHTSRRTKNNLCHRSSVASASSARRLHVSSAFEKDLHVAFGTNSPSEPLPPPLPLEVANLIKEMREMIASPLTGISTPRQDRVFDYDAKRLLNNQFLFYDKELLNLKCSGSEYSPVGLPCEIIDWEEGGQTSFSVLNDDLQLSEDSDTKEEYCDDAEATSNESHGPNLPEESSPALSCSSAGAMGETSPLTEAESDLPNPIEIEDAVSECEGLGAIDEEVTDIVNIAKKLGDEGFSDMIEDDIRERIDCGKLFTNEKLMQSLTGSDDLMEDTGA